VTDALFDTRRELLRSRAALAIFVVSALGSALLEGATYPLLYVALSTLGGGHAGGGIVGRLLREHLPSGTMSLVVVFGAVVGAQVLRVACQVLAHRHSVRIGQTFENAARHAVMGRVFETPFSRLNATKVQRLTEMTVMLPREAATWVQSSLQQLVTILMLAVYLALMLAIAPLYTGAAVVIFGAALLVVRLFLRRTRELTSKLFGSQAIARSKMTERFALLRLIFAFGEEQKAASSMSGLGDEVAALSAHRIGVTASMEPIVEGILVIALGAFALTITAARQGSPAGSLAEIVLFVAMFQRSASRLRGLASRSGQVATAAIGIKRLSGFVDELGAPVARSSELPAPLEIGIRLEGVSVRHAPDGRPALDQLSLTIPAGTTTALVGPTGSGKSTLLDLLQGLVTASEGRVLIDDRDFSAMDGLEWRRSIAVVGQDTLLFDTTIDENVRFGAPEGTSTDDVREALRVAQALAFVDELPQGVATQVGERGSRLSGGQRQKLAIARASLRRPRLLLLDEPTSSLDGESERAAMEAIRAVGKGRTTVISAHRLATIKHADQIVVLHEGRRVETGTHDELLQANGLYARLFRLQSYAAPEAVPVGG